jgi:two-component system response regulator AtoC
MEKAVLVIDDEIEIRELIEEFLKTGGHKVKTAEDGDDALEVVKKGGIKCIISDIKMPRMDGIEFVSNLRKIDANVPVIFCTGLCPSLNEKTILEGISNILIKPINFNELKSAVEMAMSEESDNFENVNKLLDEWEKLIV